MNAGMVRRMTTEPVPAPAATVDAMGKACPVPVIMLAKTMRECTVGDVVEVRADDTGAKVDIPVWCRMQRQELVGVSESEDHWTFTVRKLADEND